MTALARRVLLARYRRWCRGLVAAVETDARGPAVGRTLASAARRLQVHFNLSPEKLQWKLDFAAKKPGIFRLLTISNASARPLALGVTRTRVETKPLAGRYRDFLCTTLMDFVLAEPTAEAARALVGHVGREFLEIRCRGSAVHHLRRNTDTDGGHCGPRACGPRDVVCLPPATRSAGSRRRW